MLIIFNKSGNEFNVDFQYDSFSQGDSNTHIVDVIVEDTTFSNYEHNAYVQFLREGEKEPSDKLIMATKRFERNGNYYSGYTFKMQSDWFTAIAGTLKMTIEIKKYSNGSLQSNKAYGVVNIPVQPSVSPISEVESKITDEEYNAMIELINSKLNVADEKVYVLANNYATIYEFATACIEVAQNNLMDRIFFGNVVSTSQLGLTTTEKCVATITKKFRSQVGTSYNALVITSTGDVVVTDGNEISSRLANQQYVANYVEIVETRINAEINKKADDTSVVHNSGDETIGGVKTFEVEGAKPPIHLKSDMPYVVSDTASKVGMRAYTEDGEYQGEIAGQFAVSYNEEYGGHFANMQARDNEGTLHTLRVSKMGATYHTNKDGVSQKHDLALDENVVHNSGAETINGYKTFYKPIVVKHLDEYYDQWSKTNLGQAYINLIYNDGTVNNGIYLICGAQDSLLMMSGQNSILNLYPEKFTHSQSKNGQLVKNITVSYPTESGTLATQEWAKDYVDVQIANIIDNAPETLDTFKEIADYIKSDETAANQMLANINNLKENKADKSDLENIDYDEIKNKPDKVIIAVRSELSGDTQDVAKEFEIGDKKWKLGDTLYRHDLKVDFQNDTYYMTGYKRIYTTSKNAITKEEVVNYLNNYSYPEFKTTNFAFDNLGDLAVVIRCNNYGSLYVEITQYIFNVPDESSNINGFTEKIAFTGKIFENYVADVVDVVTEVTNGIYL